MVEMLGLTKTGPRGLRWVVCLVEHWVELTENR